MVSLRLESAESVLFFMPFKHVRARRDEFVYPLSNCRPQTYLSGKQERRKFDRRSELRLARGVCRATFYYRRMKASQGYHLIKPEDLHWRPSNLMKIPNADYLERTGSENIGARLWRLPPKSANTLHKHIRSEEFYFVLEGTGRMRVGDETLTVPKYGGVLVGPNELRQVFNDTDAEALWLIIGAPEELEFLKGSKSKMDLSLIYPTDPRQLPKELTGAEWPPKGSDK